MSRVRNRACIALSILCFAVSGVTAAERAGASTKGAPHATGIDAIARKQLVGEHLLTLQWLGFGDLSGAGTATVVQQGRELKVKGRQDGRGDAAGDYLAIDGVIVSADAKSFVFVGDVVTRVASNGDGTECRRHGTLHFRATGSRKYWRLQEMRSPCSEVTDYVDLYFLDVKRPR